LVGLCEARQLPGRDFAGHRAERPRGGGGPRRGAVGAAAVPAVLRPALRAAAGALSSLFTRPSLPPPFYVSSWTSPPLITPRLAVAPQLGPYLCPYLGPLYLLTPRLAVAVPRCPPSALRVHITSHHITLHALVCTTSWHDPSWWWTQFDDDALCKGKYGAKWDEYVRRVPYRIVPFVW